MDKEKIYFTDLTRMFIGEVPSVFFVEAFVRIFVVYLLLVISMRLMGNRMSALLTRNELVAMVVLAAAIGIPVLSPDRGLIPAIIIAGIVILTERGISALSYRNQKFEKISQGDYTVLVKDGVMQLDNMKTSRITRERLIAELRSSGLKHLGHVNRMFFEAGGSFTLIQNPEAKPGLSILPDWDEEFLKRQTIRDEILVCHNCGKSKAKNSNHDCDNCKENNWIPAIESPTQEDI